MMPGLPYTPRTHPPLKGSHLGAAVQPLVYRAQAHHTLPLAKLAGLRH